MLAGLGTDSLSGLGSTTAVLLPGVSSSAGIVLSGGSPTPGSASDASGSQSTGPVLFGGPGSGTDSTTSGASAAIFVPGGLEFFVTGESGSDAAASSAQQGSGGSTTQLPSDSGATGRITPLVYNPQSDGPPVFGSGVWTGEDGGWQVVQVADRDDAVATAADKLFGEVAEEVAKGMKNFDWKNGNGMNLGGKYKQTDAGAFGKEFERRVHARLQELAASGNKTAGQFLEGVYVDGRGLVTPGGGPGTTQVDALFVRKGYRPEVGKPLDRSRVIAYEIKTSASGRVEKDQLERLAALSDLQVRSIHSPWRYAQDARGLFGVIENTRFTTFVHVLQALGDKLPAIITGTTVVIRALSAEAQERENILQDELRVILRRLNSTTDPNERQFLELDAWNRIREILNNRGIDLEQAVDHIVIKQILLST